MNQLIEDFIACRRIAVVGASRKGTKFGNSAARELVARGYEVFLVHPSAPEIDGLLCYPSLKAVAERVQGVFVCVPPARAESVLRDAARLGLRRVWLQQGAESSELVALACELNLDVVFGKCILMYARPVRSFHRWHRAFVKLAGQF
jgi:predicted CoA-binding protein